MPALTVTKKEAACDPCYKVDHPTLKVWSYDIHCGSRYIALFVIPWEKGGTKLDYLAEWQTMLSLEEGIAALRDVYVKIGERYSLSDPRQSLIVWGKETKQELPASILLEKSALYDTVTPETTVVTLGTAPVHLGFTLRNRRLRFFNAEGDFNIADTLAEFTAKTQCNLVPEQKDELVAVYEELLAGYPRPALNT